MKLTLLPGTQGAGGDAAGADHQHPRRRLPRQAGQPAGLRRPVGAAGRTRPRLHRVPHPFPAPGAARPTRSEVIAFKPPAVRLVVIFPQAPLSPVLRGEGSGVRGLFSCIPPLTPPLSPEYRGEGLPKQTLRRQPQPPASPARRAGRPRRAVRSRQRLLEIERANEVAGEAFALQIPRRHGHVSHGCRGHLALEVAADGAASPAASARVAISASPGCRRACPDTGSGCRRRRRGSPPAHPAA